MVFYLKIYRKRKIGNRREHLSDGTIRKELMFWFRWNNEYYVGQLIQKEKETVLGGFVG